MNKVSNMENEGDRHVDGALYLRSRFSKRKGEMISTWRARYTFRGKRSYLKLGTMPDVDQYEAMARCKKVTRWAEEGIDPAEAQRWNTKGGADDLILIDPDTAFREVAREAHRRKKYRSEKSSAEWWRIIQPALKVFGEVAVAEVTYMDIFKALKPIWSTKHPTARKMVQCIRETLKVAVIETAVDANAMLILDRALARLGDHDHEVQNFNALSYEDLPAFYAALMEVEGRTTAATCLRWLILSASRSSEARGATMTEIDRDTGVWLIPAGRMKGKRDHPVALTTAHTAILDELGDCDDLLFPNTRGRVADKNIFRPVLNRMGYVDDDGRLTITPHGFRSCFRQFMERHTRFSRDQIEEALAHKITTDTEESYRRGVRGVDAAKMAQLWADFVTGDISLEEIDRLTASVPGWP